MESRFISAQAVKRLRSRYAFVLTGTPIENRIDELHSLMDFLKPGEAKSICGEGSAQLDPGLQLACKTSRNQYVTSSANLCSRSSNG